MDTNVTIPLTVVTKTISTLAKNSHGTTERAFLAELTEKIGTNISEVRPNFNLNDFYNECAVKHDWGVENVA